MSFVSIRHIHITILKNFSSSLHTSGFAMERAISLAHNGPDFLYISFDTDSLDPAYAPGTSTPGPGGLTRQEAYPVVRRLCVQANVAGLELVKVAPGWVPGYTTAPNGLRIIQEAVTEMAMRKEGITEPHCLDERTSVQDTVHE